MSHTFRNNQNHISFSQIALISHFPHTLGDSQESVVEVSSDSSSDDDSLMERIKGRKVLATPAVRRIAMENKVQRISSFCIGTKAFH